MERTIAETLTQSFDALSPAERKVARALIAEYPVAGLEPVHRLAERANVSGPTVLRMLTKIGIGSYPQLQELLRDEISQRTSSPIDQYAAASGVASASAPIDDGRPVIGASQRVFAAGLESTFAGLPGDEFDRVVALLADPKRRIWAVGGRYSSMLAEYLTMHLRLLRPDARNVGRGESDKSLALLDLGPRDVLVAFDYRRYEDATVTFISRAKARRATTVLFTDPWLSPGAKHADHLLSSSVAAPSPFDSLVPALALVESVVAGVVAALGDDPLDRIRAFDATK